MSEDFQIVLYYKKKITIGGKTPLKSVISAKMKFTNSNLNEDDMNSVLDEWNDDKTPEGREEIVSTWVMIYDDDKFIENILEVEKSEGFNSWDENSTEIIKQKLLEK